MTRESLFEILTRSETRFLDPKFSRDSRKTYESKLIARLTTCESCRQKFCNKTHEKRVSLRNFIARIASYESRGKKFRSKACFSRVSHTNLLVRLASLANRNFVVRLARIITKLNSGVLREFWVQHYNTNGFACLWVVNCETRKLRDSQASQYIAFFPSHKTRETRKTRTDIFARSESYFPQNSREKNCETRRAVNPSDN